MSDKRSRPKPWTEFSAGKPSWWWRPFASFEWACEQVAYALSRWAFLEVLEYVGKLSLLGALLAYLWTIPDRRQAAEDSLKARHYVAWQTLNSAVGKHGDAGRSDALFDLNEDHVSLAAVDLTGGAILRDHLVLRNASLERALFSGVEMRFVDLSLSNLSEASLDHSNFIQCVFQGGNFSRTVIKDNSNFYRCDFRKVVFERVPMTNSRFTSCDFGVADINTPDVTGSLFNECDFTGAKLYADSWEQAEFLNCNFANATFLFPSDDDDFGLVPGPGQKREAAPKTKKRAAVFPTTFEGCNIYGIKGAPPEFIAYAKNHGAVEIPITTELAWHKWLVAHEKGIPVFDRDPEVFEQLRILGKAMEKEILDSASRTAPQQSK